MNKEECLTRQYMAASRILTNIYLFKVNNRNTRERCEICSMLAVKTIDWCQHLQQSLFFNKLAVWKLELCLKNLVQRLMSLLFTLNIFHILF